MLYLKACICGINISNNVRCFGTIHLSRFPKSQISLGQNVSIVSSSQRCTASSIYAPTKLKTCTPDAKIVIENNVDLNGTSIVARSKQITVGEGTMIAPNSMIIDSDFHALWPPENRTMNPAFENDADVVIGKNVWIGSRCIILKGVRIGDNSVIAAGSVVVNDIPPNVVAGGNYARIIKVLDKGE
ncbi:MAG: acyltransferase [Syntrophomonadaceae bacterium]|nr:acyltransferase [Syntrophomonadaceae bacterium]